MDSHIVKLGSSLFFILFIVALSQGITKSDSILSFRLQNNGIIRDTDTSWIALNSSQKELIAISKLGALKRFQLSNTVNPVALAKDKRNIIIYDKEKNSISRWNSRMEFMDEVFLPDVWKLMLSNLCLVSSKSEYIFFNEITSELVATNQNGLPTWKKFISLQEPIFYQNSDTTFIVGKEKSDSNYFKKYRLLKISSFGSYLESKPMDVNLTPISIQTDEHNDIYILTSNSLVILPSNNEIKLNFKNLRSVIVNKSDLLLHSNDSVFIVPKKMIASDR